MKNAKHLIRAVLLLIVVVGVVDVGRRLLQPKTLGKYGHYRASDLDDQRARPVRWEPNSFDACERCHSAQVASQKKIGHAKVACMNCHGPLSAHVGKTADGSEGKTAEMPSEKSWKHCARCHQKLNSRPAGSKQVDVLEHLSNPTDPIEPDACLSCHEPHGKDATNETETKKPEREAKGAPKKPGPGSR